MKKYFVVSDVHGFYYELQTALSDASFDINNPEHILINCGDLLDRGPQPINCLNFVNNLYSNGRAILIRGNHEDLMQEALARGEFLSHDISNGTARTAYDIAGYGDRVFTEFDVIDTVRKDVTYNTYMQNTIDYYETDTHIFVHGWISCKSSDSNMYQARNVKYEFDPNWRDGNWKAARWINGMDAWNQGVLVDGKIIVCGHWHTSWGHHYIDHTSLEFPNKYSTNPEHRTADFSPFIHDGIMAIDACTALTHKVNCIVL